MWGHAKRKFYSISEIVYGCGISETGLNNCILQGMVAVHFWMPPTSVYELSETASGAQIILTKTERVAEGYTPIFPADYRRIIQDGSAHIREFPTDANGTLIVRNGVLDIIVRRDDVVILACEKDRLEEQLGLRSDKECTVDTIYKIASDRPKVPPKFDSSFRHVKFNGRDFSFGLIQASVIRQLYEAGGTSDPWRSGKKLLQDAGSESFALGNVFSKQPFWRELIKSDQRGLYQLHEDFVNTAVETLEPA